MVKLVEPLFNILNQPFFIHCLTVSYNMRFDSKGGRCWSRYYTKHQCWSDMGHLIISVSPTKQGVNVVKPTNDNNIVCGFICRNQDILSMKFLDTLLTTMLVVTGAVIILNNNIDPYWSRYYTKKHGWSL